ncbi:MAG: 6,7-dimethyl-8-ribityllumazine synthase [Bacteroidota bacterium]|nr:6,7-dimethyl-8-ribityllumazine synthase [Bacteroidota bacterium]MDP4234484.1 6,7-dimethyl-8-ribityllumazine synthase [Bacteroidota bacterium]MDP4243867.1 6,7-dimethyl-8-ribityllumazine synthase [Bacteroidota bacterium]
MSPVIKGSLDGHQLQIGIVVSRWNAEVTDGLLAGARQALSSCGVPDERITIAEVPGAFEIPLAAQTLAERACDAIVALGCVIKGETAHFEYVSSIAMQGIAKVSRDYEVPVTCGILTTYDADQAIARSRDDDDNKGAEAALAAVETANILRALRS